MRTKLFNALKVSALALLLSFGLSFVYAWTAPTQNPPLGNVSAPINTSATAQTKAGDLNIAGNIITGATTALVGGVPLSDYYRFYVNGAAAADSIFRVAFDSKGSSWNTLDLRDAGNTNGEIKGQISYNNTLDIMNIGAMAPNSQLVLRSGGAIRQIFDVSGNATFRGSIRPTATTTASTCSTLGAQAYDGTSGAPIYCNGTVWTAAGGGGTTKIASGLISGTTLQSYADGCMAVNYASTGFTSIPNIIVSISDTNSSGVGGSTADRVQASYKNVTTTGATICGLTSTFASTVMDARPSVYWYAVEGGGGGGGGSKILAIGGTSTASTPNTFNVSSVISNTLLATNPTSSSITIPFPGAYQVTSKAYVCSTGTTSYILAQLTVNGVAIDQSASATNECGTAIAIMPLVLNTGDVVQGRCSQNQGKSIACNMTIIGL